MKVCLHSNKELQISFIFHEFLDENYKSVRYEIFNEAKKFVKLKDDFFPTCKFHQKIREIEGTLH